MSGDAYSPLKAVRHLDIVQGVRQGKPVRPAHVQLIISDTCNQACGFCSYRTPGYSSSQMFYQIDPAISRGGLRRDAAHPERNYNPQRMIPWEKIAEIIDDCAEMNVSGLQFTGGGEPTVHARFLDAFRYVRNKGIACSVVSNGVLISARSMAEELATASWIRISVDAGKAATYAKIRNVPASHWDHAWSAIRDLRNARDKHGTGCTIGAGFVVTPDNWREVLLFAQCAKAAGADNVRISAQFSNENEKPFAELYDSCALLCRDAEELTGDGFTVYNRFGAKLEELRLKRPTTPFCGYQQFTTYIGADLNVYRCCVLSYNKKGIVGSLKDQRFRDLWLSQERMERMLDFDARSCDRCQFTTINKHLDYVLAADEPLHSEFV